jgi:predicted PurR-regulated permease PerM
MNQPASRFSFLNKLPWEKLIIWSLFLSVIYVLRHFFFIIFLTFLLSYSMRTLVVKLCRPFSGNRLLPWIETVVAFFCFLGLVVGIIGIGSLVAPELAQQGQALAKRVASPERSPQAQFDDYLTNSVGRWLFQQKYGDRNSPLYQEAHDRFLSPEQQREHFLEIMQSIERSFEDYLLEHSPAVAGSETSPPNPNSLSLEEWVLKNRAAAEYDNKRAEYARLWEDLYRKQEFQIPGLKQISALSHSEREAAILRFVTTSLLADETTRATLTTEWELESARSRAREIQRGDPKLARALFARFFERLRETTPYSLEQYETLRAASSGDISDFSDALQSIHSADSGKGGSESEQGDSKQAESRREQEIFERMERAKLYAEWKRGELAGKLQEKIEEHALALMSSLGGAIGQLVPKILLFPMQLLTALLLSFLITIDVPRLRSGLEKLSRTRFRHVYWEIKPGLVSFGLLIGRAFQAQGIIAIVNSALTWIAIHFLGIQNAAFLCFIVFLCSFVPVLGVVFSSVPIAIMALTQDGGSFTLAASSIAAILLIHFLETSVLNPRILGNMLHLHPVLVLTILAVCEHFFGVWGLLLGVPVVVYVIRFVILQEGIPGFIEMPKAISTEVGSDDDD